jgi:hypothetical protein
VTRTPEHVSTSYVERQNLTMCAWGMGRFTRLTKGLSKKIENFARPHKSLKNPYPRTPAMAASVANHV